MYDLILSSGDTSKLSLDFSKTIFWVGAGISKDAPTCLPDGNKLTDFYLNAMLGKKIAQKFILYWNNHIPRIRDSVIGNDWMIPQNEEKYKKYTDENFDEAKDRPRLEYVIGEFHKLDKEFQNVKFHKEENTAKYQRSSCIYPLRHFANAEPNQNHYYLAEFAKVGATIITANYDLCIEKAIGASGTVYHYHGSASDSGIENTLGATIETISRGVTQKFASKLLHCFADGFNIVFVGYSGSDFFDIQPFFESLTPGEYSGKAIYLEHCSSAEKVSSKMKKKDKKYSYLLAPFKEQIICYGKTEELFSVLQGKSDVTVERIDIEKSESEVGIKVEAELQSIYKGAEKEKFEFLNLFRLCSQLNINPGNFYLDWADRISQVYLDWEKDSETTLKQMMMPDGRITDCIIDDIRLNNWYSKNPVYLELCDRAQMQVRLFYRPEKTALARYIGWIKLFAPKRLLEESVEQTCRLLETGASGVIERDVVHYLCGEPMKKHLILWVIFRRLSYRKLKYLLDILNRLLAYPFNNFMYRTFYLSLCRQRSAICTILDIDRQPNGFYGTIQKEWNICMETPNFYDAERTIHARIIQAKLLKLKCKPVDAVKVEKLKEMQEEIVSLRMDR